MAVAFSALSLGQIQSFAPDMGKALHSASVCFAVIDSEPTMDPSNDRGRKPVGTHAQLTLHLLQSHHGGRLQRTLARSRHHLRARHGKSHGLGHLSVRPA